MSTSSISALSGLLAATQTGGPQSWRAEFRQLAQALSNGNLSAAQNAFTALTQNSSNSQTSPSNQNNPLSQDFAAIGTALQNGDLSGAQQAFQKFQQDFQALQASQGGPPTGAPKSHHRHHGSGDADQSNASSANTSSGGNSAGGSLNLTL
jgi:hypothetical protein